MQVAETLHAATVHCGEKYFIDYLERSRIGQLSQNEWVVRGQNLLISGSCGCGKTYVGYALGKNVAPLRGEHGSKAASTVLKTLPHINAIGG